MYVLTHFVIPYCFSLFYSSCYSLATFFRGRDRGELDPVEIKKAEYLTHDALRFGDGCFQHTVSSKNDFPEQAWADTLFMAGYFLARVGTLLDNKQYSQDALKQFYWHIEYLQNLKTGLFYHAYNNIEKNNMSSVYWARANAWAALTIGETCKLKIANPFDPIVPELWGAREDQLAALVRLQAEDGLWHTVLDEPKSYTETSASCGIANALVLNNNPLHKKYSDKALVGVLNRIDETGAVLGVSGGTAVMYDNDGYMNITNRRVQGWGQGLALSFLVSKLKDFK